MSRKYKVPLGLVGLSSDPVSATDGDIYYNTATDVVRVYANGAWANIASAGSGIANVVEDLTPQLGGDLDAQGNNITNVEYLGLDTTPAAEPTAAGSFWWNPEFETANLQLDTDVTLQVGQEHVIRVKNASGSEAIPNRTAVMFAGATGDTVQVSPAVSSNVATYPSDYFVGITTEEIPADGFGFVTQFGFVNQVNTNSWTVGTLLYVDPSTAGGLTSTRPAAPAWQTPVGAVTKQNASSGRLLVRAIPGIQLGRVEGVEISSPTDKELLAYNSADGTWINQTYNEAGLNKVHYQASEPLAPAVGDVWVDSDGAISGSTVPPGGVTGQVLSKNSDTDYDTEWVDVESLPTQTGNAGELLVTNGTSASWSNTVIANSSSVPAIIVKGASGQTGNLQQWQDSTGTIKSYITYTGSFIPGTSGSYISSNGHAGFYSSTNTTTLEVKASSGQTQPIQDWKNSSGTSLASVDSAGKLTAIPAGPSNATSASNVGYVGMPQVNNPSSPYTLSASDAGKHIYMTTTGRTVTIPANSVTALEIGTTVVIINGSGVTTTISINSDTLYLAGAGTTGSRTLAAFGMATIVKVSSTAWIISGNGLS